MSTKKNKKELEENELVEEKDVQSVTEEKEVEDGEELEESGSQEEAEKVTENEESAEESSDDAETEEEKEEEGADEWKNKYMRLSAEFDNYRKRTLKEKMDLTKTANEDLLVKILPVVDDFHRGIENVDKAQDIDAVKEGILLIYNKFEEFLKQSGVQEIEASEKEFDLDFHEALTKIPAPAEELKGKVVDVIERGYILNEKVIRYAKVVVGE